MGLFDSFAGGDPQNQGLLAAAAQILQQSGPSRLPTSLGQILGGGISTGLNAMTEAQRRQQEAAAAAQLSQLRDLSIQGATGDLQDKDRARQQAQALRQFYVDRASPQQQPQAAPQVTPPQMPTPQTAAQSFSGMVSGAAPGQAQAAPQAAAPTQGQPTPYQQRMQLAQALRDRGFHDQADAQEKAALAFQPKVKDWKEVQVGQNTLYAPYFEDGTTGQPVPLAVAQKLQFQNLGGKTVGLNPFTGAQVAAFDNTQSPDSVASNAVTMRGQNMQQQTAQAGLNTPQFNADAGGFVYKPTAANPGGQFQPLDGFAKADKPLTESQGKASLFVSRMAKADQIMGDLASKGTQNPSAIKSSLEGVPLIGGALSTAGNYAASGSQQQLEQAQRDFVNATLRLESGAAIAPSEFDSAAKQYFPQRGDSPEVIAQKAANRQTAIQGMALMSGPGAAKLGVGAPNSGASNAAPLRSAIKGQVMDGYRFKGGDPSDQTNWEKI